MNARPSELPPGTALRISAAFDIAPNVVACHQTFGSARAPRIEGPTKVYHRCVVQFVDPTLILPRDLSAFSRILVEHYYVRTSRPRNTMRIMFLERAGGGSSFAVELSIEVVLELKEMCITLV
jgi:hypothetical protein